MLFYVYASIFFRILVVVLPFVDVFSLFDGENSRRQVTLPAAGGIYFFPRTNDATMAGSPYRFRNPVASAWS
jgi:hypothetical protein